MAQSGEFKSVRDTLWPRLVHPARHDDVVLKRAVFKMMDDTGPETFIRQQKAIISRPDSRPSLGMIHCTTLVLGINLPGWLADSAGFGIQIDAVVHSTGQLISKYGHDGLNTVWSTTGVKVFLGGIHHADTLKKVSLLGGTMPGREAGENPCLPVEYLMRLPRWRALVINDDLCPVAVKFRPVWRRTRHRLGLHLRPPLLTAARAETTLDLSEELAALTGPAAAAAPAGDLGNGHHPLPWPGTPADGEPGDLIG